jgi:hypothetical protein
VNLLKSGSINLDVVGPKIAMNKTYAAESDPSCGSKPTPTPKPAMTMENSPRAINDAPARNASNEFMFAYLAESQPIKSFVSAVKMPNETANSKTGGKEAGLICNPKNKKKMAANKSRSGKSNLCARLAIGSETAMPTRNAPMAAETCSFCAIPATNKIKPKVVNRITSSDWCEII